LGNLTVDPLPLPDPTTIFAIEAASFILFLGSFAPDE
jgi:hypothetical protein